MLLPCLKHNFLSPVLALLLNCYGYVLCLIIIAGDYRRLLLTVTGFTLAHSVTLSLATLNIFRLLSELVECLIALSILLLAKEIIKRSRAGTGVQDKLTWRHPVSASSVFGLSQTLVWRWYCKSLDCLSK